MPEVLAMAASRNPGPISHDPFSVFVPARTPGSLGVNDAADPDAYATPGDTPVPVGMNNLPVLRAGNMGVQAQAAQGNSSPEIWFRGEAAGVKPSAPGGNLHDFGDGLYLTDTEDVAWQYARTRAQGEYKDYRVFTVQLARSTLGNVLDLTLDRRWDDFMTRADPMFLGKNRLYYVKQQNELYGQFFAEFLKVNKISPSSYDAVIGPEYVRGGKQLCILSTKLSTRVRALLEPEPWAARLAASQGAVKARPGTLEPTPISRTGTRIWGRVALTLGTTALIGLVGYLNQKVVDKWNEKHLQRSLKELEPEIEKYIAARERIILDYSLDSTPVYVVATLCLFYSSSSLPPEITPGDVEYTSAVLIGVQIDSLGPSSRKLEGEVQGDWKRHPPKFPFGGGRLDVFEYNISYPITPYAEDISRYRDFEEQRKWYEETIRNPALLNSDIAQLRKKRDALYDLINRNFSPTGEFKPNPAMWTEDGLAKFTGQTK
jgi:hypothetical protein